MVNQQSDTEKWLTLSQAAGKLGIHATTLRRWADNGDILVMLTPGGHRRFAASEIARFAQDQRNVSRSFGMEQVLVNQALTQTRQEIVVRQDQPWITTFDEAARTRYRVLGRQLLGLTLQYLSDENGGDILEEARYIGQQYAEIGVQSQLPLAEALEASMFFRDMLIETALQLPENARIRPEANVRLLRRINNLLNSVQLAIAEAYDAHQSDNLPRS